MKIKNRKIPIILGTCGVIAVSTIGFASWIIGYQHTQIEHDLIVEVTGQKMEGLILECVASDTSIKLAETSTPSGENNTVTSETTDGDFTIDLSSFKLNVTKGFLKAHPISSIDFAVSGLPSASVSNTDTFGRTNGSYSYIQLANQNFNLEGISPTDGTQGMEEWEIYDLSSKGPIKFEWGTMFDLNETSDKKDSPAEFYNKKITSFNTTKPMTDPDNQATLAKWKAASTELEAMKTAFTGKTIKVKVSVNFN